MSLTDELEREVAHSDHMVAMAHYWMRRAQDAESTLAVVVKAAGGKVVVHLGDVEDAPNLKLVKLSNEEDMTVHFIARKELQPAATPLAM